MRTIIASIALIVLGSATWAQEPFVKNDTTFLQRDTVGHYHAVYIAVLGDSAWYDQVAGPIADLSEDKWVKSQRKALDELGKKSPGVAATEYFTRRDWVPVKRWKGTYYLYKPSDFAYHRRIQQLPRLIITEEEDGPLAHVVVDFPAAVADSPPSVRYPCVTLVSHAMDPKHDTLDVRLYRADPATELTLWEFTDAGGDTRYELMVPRKNARLFPIIVNYSPSQKEREFEFEVIGPDLLKR